MAIINDIYDLNLTTPITIDSGSEADSPLTLQDSIAAITGSITGTVFDTTLLTGDTIAGATVKIFKLDGTPVMHTVTGTNGSYTLSDITPGTYLLSASKDGYYFASDITVIVLAAVTLPENIVLLPNTKADTSTIYGIITDDTSDDPIDEVSIALYQDIAGELTQIAATKTISDGEYVLEDIPAGTYTLVFSKANYETSEVNVTTTEGSKEEESASLTASSSSTLGTISGLITNNLSLPIPNAFVGLYLVEGDTETLIATTYTNLIGKYMFGDVADGEYIVKAKASGSL